MCRHSTQFGLLLALLLALLPVSRLAVAGEFSDPTRPPGQSTHNDGPKTSYRLQSVLYSGSRKVAIINGISYMQGDNTPLGRLVDIDEYRVVILGQRRQVLKLPASVKQKVASK